MDKVKLNNCPFCQSDDVAVEVNECSDMPTWWYEAWVECKQCDSFSTTSFNSRNSDGSPSKTAEEMYLEAVNAWNGSMLFEYNVEYALNASKNIQLTVIARNHNELVDRFGDKLIHAARNKQVIIPHILGEL